MALPLLSAGCSKKNSNEMPVEQEQTPGAAADVPDQLKRSEVPSPNPEPSAEIETVDLQALMAQRSVENSFQERPCPDTKLEDGDRCIMFKDTEGSKRFELRLRTEPAGESQNHTLEAVLYRGDRPISRVRDATKYNCKGIGDEFTVEAIHLADVDGNGIAELSLYYSTDCIDDPMPYWGPAKLIVLEGTNKYKLRGRRGIGNDNPEFEIDPGFQKASWPILEEALDDWMSNFFQTEGEPMSLGHYRDVELTRAQQRNVALAFWGDRPKAKRAGFDRRKWSVQGQPKPAKAPKIDVRPCQGNAAPKDKQQRTSSCVKIRDAQGEKVVWLQTKWKAQEKDRTADTLNIFIDNSQLFNQSLSFDDVSVIHSANSDGVELAVADEDENGVSEIYAMYSRAVEYFEEPELVLWVFEGSDVYLLSGELGKSDDDHPLYLDPPFAMVGKEVYDSAFARWFSAYQALSQDKSVMKEPLSDSELKEAAAERRRYFEDSWPEG